MDQHLASIGSMFRAYHVVLDQNIRRYATDIKASGGFYVTINSMNGFHCRSSLNNYIVNLTQRVLSFLQFRRLNVALYANVISNLT